MNSGEKEMEQVQRWCKMNLTDGKKWEAKAEGKDGEGVMESAGEAPSPSPSLLAVTLLTMEAAQFLS